MKIRNMIYGAIMIAIGAFVLMYAGRYAATIQLGSGSTGGDFFPRIMAGGLVITGVVILCTEFFSKNQVEESASPVLWRELLITIASCVGYYLLFQPLGFIIDSIWIVAFFMYRLGCRKWYVMGIYSIVMPAAIFSFFYYVLYVGLPLGLLESILPKY